jgi:hypothetical protein
MRRQRSRRHLLCGIAALFKQWGGHAIVTLEVSRLTACALHGAPQWQAPGRSSILGGGRHAIDDNAGRALHASLVHAALIGAPVGSATDDVDVAVAKRAVRRETHGQLGLGEVGVQGRVHAATNAATRAPMS